MRRAAAFHSHLAQLIDSGVTLPRALVLAGEAAGGRYGAKGEAWSRAVEANGTIHEAMAGEPALTLALIEAGEKTGRLPATLRLLSSTQETLATVRDLIVGKLIYPALLIHLALVVLALPGVATGKSSPWMLLLGPAILWAVILGVVAWSVFWHRQGAIAHLVLRPGPGFLAWPWIRLHTLTVLRAGLSAGLLASQALELAANASGNRVVGDRLRAAARELAHQRLPNLSTALRNAGFPSGTCALVELGEVGGTLEKTLDGAIAEARFQFEMRATWTAKVIGGICYAIAVGAVLFTVVSVYSQVLSGAISAAEESAQ